MIPLSALFPRYEEEVSLRATAENEFVALKKVSKFTFNKIGRAHV